MAPVVAVAALSGFATNALIVMQTWVSPWMVAGLLINYASNIDKYKQFASLLFQARPSPPPIICIQPLLNHYIHRVTLFLTVSSS